MAKLTTFSAENVCPKCGGAAAARYESRIESDPCWYDRKYNPPGKWPEHEFIRRTCEQCHYQWPEKCLGSDAGRATLKSEPITQDDGE